MKKTLLIIALFLTFTGQAQAVCALKAGNLYVCLSSDSKPIASEGTRVYEINAADASEVNLFVFQGGQWKAVNSDLRTFSQVTGVPIPRGTWVYVTPGSRLGYGRVAPARADSSDTMPAIGIVETEIPHNGLGKVRVVNFFESANTAAFTEGDRLFISETTSGEATNIEPSHPNLKQRVGVVTVSNATTGKILVDPTAMRGDHEGTNRNEWKIGDGITETVKAVEFVGPNYTKTLTATPDASVTYKIEDFADGHHAAKEGFCSGLHDGGALSINVNQTSVDIAAGSGHTNDHINPIKYFSWGQLNVTPIGNGTNYVYIDQNGNGAVSLTKPDMAVTVYLGHFFANGGYIIEIFPVPEWSGHFTGRVNDWMAQAAGTIVSTGLSVSEQANPNFKKISVSAGEFHARLGKYQINSPITDMRKMYNTSDLSWQMDATEANTVNVTHWNNPSLPNASARVTMTAGYWKKDMILMVPSGRVYYIYAQSEYATEDGAKAAALPAIPSSIKEDSMYLAAVVVQKDAATLAGAIYDIRPNFDRVFGHGSAAASIATAHSSLTELDFNSSGHTGFASTDASSLTAGTLDGNRLPSMSTTKRGGVPATGTPAGLFLRDDGTWQAASGGSGAPTDAEYITYSANATLSNERVLTAGTLTTIDTATEGQVKVNFSGTMPQNQSAVANNFLTAYNSSTGAFSAAQPAYSGLTGLPTLPQNQSGAANNFITAYNSSTGAFSIAQPAYSGLTGLPTLAQTDTGAANNFFTAYNASTGLFTKAQPSFTNISGTATDGQLPATISASKVLATGSFANSTTYELGKATPTSVVLNVGHNGTSALVNTFRIADHTHASSLGLGGQIAYSALTGTPTLPQNQNAVTNSFFTAYNSTTGAFTVAQPAFSNLSGSATDGQLPATITASRVLATGSFADATTYNLGKTTPSTVTLNVGHNGTSALVNTFNIAPHAHSTTAGSGGQIAISDTTGTLAISRGGTNATATPTAGAVPYGTGTAYAFSAAGSTGDCLKSGGTGAPTWGACATGGSVSPGSPVGSVQYNNAGAFGGMANVAATAAGDLNLLDPGAEPLAPASGVTIFSRTRAGRRVPAFIGPSGLDSSLSPALWANHMAAILPSGGTTTAVPTTWGGITLGGTGTVSNPAPAATNLSTSLTRVVRTSTTTAGANANFRGSVLRYWRGNAAGLGGFFYAARWLNSVHTATDRGFYGMANQNSDFGNVNPSTLLHTAYFGWDSGQTTIRYCGNDGTGAATCVDCGANFPSNSTTAVYEALIFAPPNGSSISFQLNRFDAAVAPCTGTISAAGDLPASTTFLNPHMWINNGTTAAAVALDLIKLYIEADY